MSKIVSHFVVDHIELPGIKMQLVKVCLVANPNYSFTQSKSKTGFKVDPGAILSEIGNHKSAVTNKCNYLIVNTVHMFRSVDTNRFVSSIFNRRTDALFISGSLTWIERHRDKGTWRCFAALIQIQCSLPAVQGDHDVIVGRKYHVS